MISEINFSRGYSSFWNEYFPWLSSYCQSNGSIKQVQPEISISDLPAHRSINNTIAFFYFKDRFLGKENLEVSKKDAMCSLMRFPRNNLDSYEFSDLDQLVINNQVLNLEEVYKKNLSFSPSFSGCGIISNCNGDIIQKSKLIEIKAGSRYIAPSDIKQLIVYSALSWISGESEYSIDTLELYNPRMGYLWSESIEDLFSATTLIPKEDIYDFMSKYLVVQSEDLG